MRDEKIRREARKAFLEADDEERLRRAVLHRNRPAAAPLQEGDLVYVSRKGLHEVKQHWHGPGHVLGQVGARIWVALGAKVYRCSLIRSIGQVRNRRNCCVCYHMACVSAVTVCVRGEPATWLS